ncbi:MAG: hypothetical protein JWO58_1309 [Chitinophagaceae bacterium]|nr:hypothetical protein [Chitinophagaceae bacterium]
MIQRILPFCFFIVFLWSCGAKENVPPKYDQYPFGNADVTSVQVNGFTIITLQQDSINRVIRKTQGDPQVSNYGGYLMVNGGGEVVIGVKKTLSIGLNGGGVRSLDSLSMKQLFISGQNAAVNLKNIHVDSSITVAVQNTGDWIMSGKTPYLYVGTTNLGRFFGFDLVTDSCVVYHGGTSDVQVNVKQKLTGSVNSIGNLFYKGNPRIVNVSTVLDSFHGKAIPQQ